MTSKTGPNLLFDHGQGVFLRTSVFPGQSQRGPLTAAPSNNFIIHQSWLCQEICFQKFIRRSLCTQRWQNLKRLGGFLFVRFLHFLYQKVFHRGLWVNERCVFTSPLSLLPTLTILHSPVESIFCHLSISHWVGNGHPTGICWFSLMRHQRCGCTGTITSFELDTAFLFTQPEVSWLLNVTLLFSANKQTAIICLGITDLSDTKLCL